MVATSEEARQERPSLSFIQGFKNFLMQGDVVIVAIGLVVALAFSTLISSFTTNIINPLVQAAGGGGTSGLGFTVNGRVVDFGAFLSDVIYFVIFMLVSERTSNLVEEGIDLAIRNGSLSDSSLIARKIGVSAIIAVASTEYLKRKGEPRRPSDLDDHDGVIFV